MSILKEKSPPSYPISLQKHIIPNKQIQHIANNYYITLLCKVACAKGTASSDEHTVAQDNLILPVRKH